MVKPGNSMLMPAWLSMRILYVQNMNDGDEWRAQYGCWSSTTPHPTDPQAMLPSIPTHIHEQPHDALDPMLFSHSRSNVAATQGGVECSTPSHLAMPLVKRTPQRHKDLKSPSWRRHGPWPQGTRPQGPRLKVLVQRGTDAGPRKELVTATAQAPRENPSNKLIQACR